MRLAILPAIGILFTVLIFWQRNIDLASDKFRSFKSESLAYKLVTPGSGDPEWFWPYVKDPQALQLVNGLDELPSQEQAEKEIRKWNIEDNFRSYNKFDENNFRITYSLFNSEGESVGMIGMRTMRWNDTKLVNNIYLYVQKNMRKRGYGSEAAIAFSNFVFENISMRSQQWTAAHDNTASQKIATYAGFQYSHDTKLMVYLKSYENTLNE